MAATRPPESYRRPSAGVIQPGQAYEGHLASTPGDSSELVDVAVDLLGGGRHTIRDCRWTAHGTTLPATGDPCAIVITDRRRGIVVWWEPA